MNRTGRGWSAGGGVLDSDKVTEIYFDIMQKRFYLALFWKLVARKIPNSPKHGKLTSESVSRAAAVAERK